MRRDEQPAATAEAGFSLLEVVVSMMLLALLATVTLPLFITGMSIAADTNTKTTATAQVSALLERLRAGPDCATLQDVVAPYPSAGPRRFWLVLDVEDACAPDQAVRVRATAKTELSATHDLASATTIIYVPADETS